MQIKNKCPNLIIANHLVAHYSWQPSQDLIIHIKNLQRISSALWPMIKEKVQVNRIMHFIFSDHFYPSKRIDKENIGKFEQMIDNM